MTTQVVRRLYIYVAAFVGLQMLSFGIGDLITFLGERWLVRVPLAGGELSALRMAGSVALVLVGVLLWLGHWLLIRRDAEQPEGRASALRRLYAYAVLFVAAITILLALRNTWTTLLAAWWEQGSLQPLIGSLADGAVAGLVWFLHWRIFSRDRALVEVGGVTAVLRRWYLALVRAVSLIAASVGAGMLTHYLLRWYVFDLSGWYWQIIGPLAGLISGMLIWVPHELWARRLVHTDGPLQDGELRSLLRQVYSALAITLSLITVLSGLTALLAATLRAILGAASWFDAFAGETRAPAALAVGIPLLLYHRAQLLETAQISALSERMDTARRVLVYLIAAVSLAALYAGLGGLIATVARVWLHPWLFGDIWRTPLSWYSATALVALPVYVLAYRQSERLVRETSDEERALGRRIYLYAGLLFGVIGASIALIWLIRLLIAQFLGFGALQAAGEMVRFAGYLLLSSAVAWIYGMLVQRANALRGTVGAGKSIVAIVDAHLQPLLLAALAHELPGACVRFCGEHDSLDRRAALLSADLLLLTPAALGDRSLNEYNGLKLLLSTPPPGMILVGARVGAAGLAREAARQARALCLAPSAPPLMQASPGAA